MSVSPAQAGLRALRILTLTVAMAVPLASRAAAGELSPPKLIVAISIDQYSANLFDEWRSRYTGGFARLASGVVYSSGYQTHAGTETCPGHSTLLTGKHPNKTGIVANTYRDPETGKMIEFAPDKDIEKARAKASGAMARCTSASFFQSIA